MSESTLDLRGHERQPFASFDEETTYLERVNVTDRDEAVRMIGRGEIVGAATVVGIYRALTLV